MISGVSTLSKRGINWLRRIAEGGRAISCSGSPKPSTDTSSCLAVRVESNDCISRNCRGGRSRSVGPFLQGMLNVTPDPNGCTMFARDGLESVEMKKLCDEVQSDVVKSRSSPNVSVPGIVSWEKMLGRAASAAVTLCECPRPVTENVEPDTPACSVCSPTATLTRSGIDLTFRCSFFGAVDVVFARPDGGISDTGFFENMAGGRKFILKRLRRLLRGELGASVDNFD